jgi:BASS family bile acid:Na+ symporter
MDFKTLVPIIVQSSLFLLTLAVGMRSEWSDLLYVFRRPADFVRALVAVNVVVPVAAILSCAIFPIDWPTKGGLLVMAVSPLAPFATGKMLKFSADRSYDVGLYSALILAAVIIVPLTMALLSPWYEHHATISVGVVAWFVFGSVFIPLLAGIVIATIWPRLSARAAPIANLIAYLLLLPPAALILFKSGKLVMSLIGDGTVVAINLIIIAALAGGHFLGGSKADHRFALAQAAATRHPGIAGLIAAGNYAEHSQVSAAILLFVIVSIVLTAVYGKWAKTQLSTAKVAHR